MDQASSGEKALLELYLVYSYVKSKFPASFKTINNSINSNRATISKNTINAMFDNIVTDSATGSTTMESGGSNHQTRQNIIDLLLLANL